MYKKNIIKIVIVVFAAIISMILAIAIKKKNEDKHDEEASLLALSWSEREEKVYPEIFGTMPTDICQPADDSTSGLSNPFEDTPDEYSGLGFELVIRCAERSPWVFGLLFNLMGYALHSGNAFEKGHRMALNGPILQGSNSALTTVLLWPPMGMPDTFALSSGNVKLLEVIGITDDEYEYAKKNSSQDLYNHVKKMPDFPLMNIHRKSCLRDN
ncbi:MAG: suppressor of fused domain protein [Candidatus Dependentiae bacterium]|nr:suppressor of fused domain protein [Candidatus Dependentiae bacterium]